MAISHSRFQPGLVIGFAEAPRVSELKTEHQISYGAVAFLMSGDEGLTKFREIGLVVPGQDKLVWIRPTIGPNGHGLAATDKFGPTFSEPAPSPQDIVGNTPAYRAIPAFHGLCGVTVTDALAINENGLDGLAEWRIGTGGNIVLTWDVKAEVGNLSTKLSDSFEGRDPREFGRL